MAVVSFEKKLEAIQRYQAGASQSALCRELGVSVDSFRQWRCNYNSMGEEGLRSSGGHTFHSKETKERAVKDYLSGQGGLRTICQKYQLRSIALLRDWVRVYHDHQEPQPATEQRRAYMIKGKKTTQQERAEIVSFCIESGKDYPATMEKYGVSYGQIYSWVRKVERFGAEGLEDKRGRRKSEEEMTTEEKLKAQCRLLEAKNRRLEMENSFLKKLKEREGRWG